nr:nickel pincer cofactor biosynthesis protein LarC [uncultured Blautia sp.]
MGKSLYLECYSGISGDMTVAALLDLGADQRVLEEVLGSLPVQGFEIKVSRVKKSGIDACDFDVILDKEIDGHDHDMEYLHGQGHEDGTRHGQGHEHEQEHEDEPSHEHSHGHSHEMSHHHRGMKEIRQIIEASKMTDGARKTALAIFGILAEAEAKAHNVPVEEVHFHEVGAVDSIVDILSVAVCLDNLGITEVIVPVLYEGTGTIRCQHGILPVPVPAVTNIVQQCGLEFKITPVSGELVTPTGAAIVAAVRTSCKLPENFTIEKTGMGAGKRNYECPGILRAMLINTEVSDSDHSDHIYKLETNIDDCSGEILGFVMERLFEAGARDVHYTPVYMKKNRPAWLLTVICKEEDIQGMEALIFAETTSIGIRRVRMERTILPRKKIKVMIPFGEVEVKICGPEGAQKCYPEYESLAKICRKTGISYSEAYQMAVEAGKNLE